MSKMEISLPTAASAQIDYSYSKGADGRAIDFEEHLGWIRQYHPQVSRIIPNVRALGNAELAAKTRALDACSEFAEKGRGLQWATTTDQHLQVRKVGAGILLRTLEEAAERSTGLPAEEYYLLDVFGGAGFIAQFARDVYGFNGVVITSDPSAVMVQLTLQKRLPALWQRAQDLFMTEDNSVDAVLFAYGTHHVPIDERQQCFNEAMRVLKPNGVLIFHDFEDDTPTVHWFRDVVDVCTMMGHKHEHFKTDDLRNYFTTAGFEIETVTTIDDCFQFTAPTQKDARFLAIDFMGGAYGLEKLKKSDRTSEFLWDKITTIFTLEEISHEGESETGFTTIIHRPALLGVGRKSTTHAA
jgi:ubiquinone/menaquinone biosynthesis C-methylase UbiE